MNHASYFGHRFTVHHRPPQGGAVAGGPRPAARSGELPRRPLHRLVHHRHDPDPSAVADDAAARSLKALDEDGSEVIILGCTIIAGCLEREIMTTGRHRELPILNPNLLALKAAETLADLHQAGKYAISRAGPIPAPRAARSRPRPPTSGDAGSSSTSTIPRPASDGRRRTRSQSTARRVVARLPRRRHGRAVRDRRRHADRPRDPGCARRRRARPRRGADRHHDRAAAAERGRAAGRRRRARCARPTSCCARPARPSTTRRPRRPRSGPARVATSTPRYRADAWRNGAMTADFFAIREQAERLAALWRGTREVRVTSPAGTDLRATVDRARADGLADRHLPRTRARCRRCPAARSRCHRSKGTSEGVVVWERVASDLGALDEPVRIEVRGGRAVAFGGGEASAARLREIVATIRDADNIGEIGIGLNRGRADRRRDHRGQEGARHCPHRARRFGQRVRRDRSSATSTSMAW